MREFGLCPVDRSPLCFRCYDNAKGRSNHKGHCHYRPARPSRESIMSKFVRDRRGTVMSPQPASTLAEYPMSKTHPALWEYLTLSSWEDGSPRQTATLSIFWGPNGLQAALNDRDASMVAFVTGDDPTALLASLEHGLQHDALDWRQSYQGKGQKRKK